jgi:hypothetical protein
VDKKACFQKENYRKIIVQVNRGFACELPSTKEKAKKGSEKEEKEVLL